MNDRSYLLLALFEFFDREAVEYCVLGDTRDFPASITSDVDLAVDGEMLGEMPRLLARFCRGFDLRMVQMLRHEQTALYFVLAWAGETGELGTLAIDVCSEYRRRGRRFLRAEELLELRERAHGTRGEELGFYVPATQMQFIYYLIKRIDKLELNAHTSSYLSWLWRCDPYRARHQLERFWRRAADVELLRRAAENDEWACVRAQLRQLRRGLRRGARRSVADFAGEARRALGRVLWPTGLVVAFLGPDGAGKSSLIEGVLGELAPVFRRTRTEHLRPRLLAARHSSAPVADPHALPPRGAPASAAKLALFVFDYAVGYALRTAPAKVRSTLVAFDRYMHDVLVDPHRYRYGGPMFLARWAARLVPAPDLWLILDAPAGVLAQRKAELSADEAERQRAAYRRLARRLRGSIVLDARAAPASVCAEAILEILRRLEERLAQRCPQLRLHDNPRAARVLVFLSRHRVPIASRLCRILFNSDLYAQLPFAPHMPHPYGIVVHSKTVIGQRVTLMQQVTLGGKDLGQDLAPVLEDDVYVGAGAKVLGAVRVGRGALIGANAVITRDVPPYCTVVGANRIVRGSVVDAARAREATAMAVAASPPLDGRISA